VRTPLMDIDDLHRPDRSRPSAAPEKPAEAPAPAPVSTAPPLEAKRIKLSNMRKTIAKRLVESKTTIPHFQVTVAVNTEPLEQLRAEVNADLADDGIKLSVNDFITRACALALLQHPRVNAAWADGEIIQHGSINIGFAVALPEEQGGGLVVPVLHHAHAKTLRQLNAETKALAKKARSTGLSVEDMQDGTFCVSNLGMYGVEHFTAIINPPQAAILAVGAALDKPVVRDGQLVAGREMQMTLSGDHRVIDGATAAEFLQTVQKLLEKPRALMA